MFLKNLVVLLGLSLPVAEVAVAASEPRGNLIELHSCEVYAGGCVVSSEATLGGRTTLQIWDVTGGTWNGIDLSGLRAGVLESSSQNLASPEAKANQAVIYLPENSTADQRSALLSWLKSRNPQLSSSTIQTRIVPVTLATTAKSITFAAGKYARAEVASAGDCENRVCGEDLWYQPSTTTSIFTVGLNAGSQVNEPLIGLKWTDHGKRSVFLACFGDSIPAQNVFVKSSDWCGSIGNFY
jgi:hypothetical protein